MLPEVIETFGATSSAARCLQAYVLARELLQHPVILPNARDQVLIVTHSKHESPRLPGLLNGGLVGPLHLFMISVSSSSLSLRKWAMKMT
jgi:hypothetical protein